MSRNRKRRNSGLKNSQLSNGLTDLATNLGNSGTGGSYLSSYSSQAFTNNYALLTLNRIILTYMYTGNGIFQTAIQLPIQDAIGKGIIIESSELDNTDIEEIYALWEEKDIWGRVLDYMTWVRLFGGGGLLINTNQDPEKPLNINKLHNKPFDLYDLDRWQLDTGIQLFDELETSRFYSEQDKILLYGEQIHKSRFMLSRGKRAPHYIRQQLRGWGMSEGERMIRALNATAKAQDASFELIDEAKIDVYKIDGLANKLLTAGGTNKITQRIQAANMIKNYVNALVLDSKEEFEQKMVNFAGLAEVMNQNRIETASAVRMPMTKLYGLSSNGFNTGESDLENYNQMVEFSVRTPLRPTLRQLIEISCAHLFGYVPSFNFTYPPLREQTPEVEQNVKTQETNRILSFYDRGLMDSKEVMESARKAGIIQIETKAETGLLPPQPIPPQPASDMGGGSGVSTQNPTIGKEHSKSSPAPGRNSVDDKKSFFKRKPK